MRTAQSIIRLLCLSQLGWAMPGQLAADEGATARLRVLPVGDPPPFRQRIQGEVRQQVAPVPGTVPPPEIRLAEGPPLRLRLGSFSQRFELPKTGTDTISLHAGDSAEPWVAFPRPTAPSATLVVWRDPSPATWSQPHAVLVPDDPERFPAGKGIVINLLPSPLAVRGGGGDELLPPGTTCLRNIDAAEDRALHFAFRRADGEWQKLPSHHSEPGEGIREWIIIFRSDQPNPRRHVGRLSLREAVIATLARPATSGFRAGSPRASFPSGGE